MGPAVTPAEARLGAVTMAMLALLAVVVAGMVYGSSHRWGLPLLFLGLAAIGAWQTRYYHRLGKR